MTTTRLTARSSRPAIENEIERLIGLLDARDLDADMEDNGDLEPSLGVCFRGHVDIEDDRSDDEPSLGSLDRAVDQTLWSGPDCVNASLDLELQLYASEGRKLDLRSWELERRGRQEVERLDAQLSVLVAAKARRAKAASRVAQRASR